MKKLKNTIFAVANLLIVVLFLSSCSSENSLAEWEVEPTPTPTPTDYTYKLLADGTVDSSYVKFNGSVTAFYTEGFVASQYEKVEKKTGDVEETKTYLSPYKNVHTLTVSGDGVKVPSKVLELSTFAIGEVSEGTPRLQVIKGDSSFVYEMKRAFSIGVKTASETDVVISAEVINQRFESFLDGKNNRVAEIPYIEFKSFEYAKYTLDSLKTINSEEQKAFYSFYFNDVRQAKFFAGSRYDWGSTMKTRAMVAGEEVEVSSGIFYNKADALTEPLKVTVVLIVPADGKEPEEKESTYENDKLVKKDNEYYTSSNDKYKNYDNGTQVLEKSFSLDINIAALFDSDPSIINLGKASITSVGTSTFKKTAGTKTNKTIGEFYIEKQPISWVATWSYGTGSVTRTVSTIEEYPYIIDGSKKVKMLSSNWTVTLKSATMNNGVDYTYNGKSGKLYTQTVVFEAVYYNETRTFTGENKFFVEADETAQQTGWEIFNSAYKKVDNSFYNTYGDLYKIFSDDTKTLDSKLSKDYAVTASVDADGNIIVLPSKENIGKPSLKETDGTKTNRTEGSYFIETQPKTWAFTWSGSTGVVRKVSTVEEYVSYMAGSNKLAMAVGSWSKVEVTATVNSGASYTHNSKKGTLYTETLVFKATYGSEVRTLETRYNKYFVAEPDAAVVTVTEVSKDYTVQTSDVKSWINFSISTLYDGNTTSKDSIATDLFQFGFDAAAAKSFKKTSASLNYSSSSVSKSTSVVGTKTTNKVDLNVVLQFGDGTTSTLTFPGFYTTGTVSVRGKNYTYSTPALASAYSNIEQVGNVTTVEEGSNVYKRTTYKVTATATIDGKTINRETTVTVDVEVKQQVNPDKGEFKYFYETYTPSLDNQLHRAIVIAWEKQIDMIVDGSYYKTVANPDASKTFQSVLCSRNGSSWSWAPATVSIPSTGWWRYTDNAGERFNWSWQINASLLGLSLKEADWNQAGHTNYTKSIDSDGYTVVTVYDSNGSVIHQSK
ncbi:MAG: hypothetical protein ACK5N8_05345 [Alphaproteobacteria bacterium]